MVLDAWTLGKRTRQGCPLLPVLFVLPVERFANRLREKLRHWGIDIDGKKHVVYLYADNVLVYLGDPAEAMALLIKELYDFAWVSGLHTNKMKSHLFPLEWTEQRNWTALQDLELRWESEWL
ncbi:hypothetical protein NDU88_002754 [Pleurodeles waltl]|uniref:Reverse transcriptase domain-containing protein n=1 Tax=Pleurodeles waltl TaxID=8319 RepID=A0AAV7MSL0_PLEWA|nr:hypothetical protein NDU88_002754 [Pleurodeles waltl]